MAAKKASKKSAFGAKDYLLPEVTSLSDLFASVEIRPVNAKFVPAKKLKIGELDSTGYCQVYVVASDRAFDSLTIQPSALLAGAVASSMIKVDYDEIFFEIIVFADSSSRVIAKYSQILGSRWIAEFDAKATRAFFRKLSKDLGYATLPRAKKAI